MSDGKLTYDTRIDTKGFETGMSKIGQATSKAFSAFMKFATIATTAFIGVGTYAVKYNAELEQYNTSFETMTGSAEKAAEVMEKLKKLGAATPFELSDLAKATQTLMAFGFSADEAIEQFQILGDISQGNADKLDSFTLALGKMESSGKVTLETLNIMIERGFNPLQVIADKTGESMGALYDRVSAGTLSLDEIKEAMVIATSEGGQFFQAMDKQSQTLNGRLSTLSDTVKNKLGEAFTSVSDKLRDEIIPKMIEFVESIDVEKAIQDVGNFLEVLKNLLPVVGGIATATLAWQTSVKALAIIKGITSLTDLWTIATLKLNAAIAANPIGFVISLITGLISAIVLLYQTNEEFRAYWDAFWADMFGIVEWAVTGIGRLIDAMFGWLFDLVGIDLEEKLGLKVESRIKEGGFTLEQYMSGQAGGDTYNVEIKAGDVKEFNDITRKSQDQRQYNRMGTVGA